MLNKNKQFLLEKIEASMKANDEMLKNNRINAAKHQQINSELLHIALKITLDI